MSVLSTEVETSNGQSINNQADYVCDCLTISDCGALYERIKISVSKGQAVFINLSNCHEIDTSGLQFLVMIRFDPMINGKVHWSELTDEIVKKAETLGMISWVVAGIKKD